MIIEWIRGGLEVKGVGMTVEGVSVEVDDVVGQELIDNGLAKKGKKKEDGEEVVLTNKETKEGSENKTTKKGGSR